MRIVSLCPSITELLFALDRGADLVGVTSFCNRPAQTVHIAKVGGTKNPKIDRILAMRPDLVLLNEEENRREDADALLTAGVACHVSLPKTPLEAAQVVRAIGSRVQREAQAAAIAARIEAEVAQAEAAGRGLQPVRYACLIWRRPWMAIGTDTYIDGVLACAGGENALATIAQRYPTIDADALRRADPQAILLSSEPFPFAARHASELARATGLAEARMHLVDGRLLSWHGVSTIAGIGYARELFAACRRGA